MSYKFLGTYKNYNVYKHPYTASARECPSDGNIYLVPSGTGYEMVLNGVPCGYCDSRYCVEEFEEPRSNEIDFTSSSWATDPNPQVEKEEPAEPETAATSSDFWTRVQEDINAVLKSTAI